MAEKRFVESFCKEVETQYGSLFNIDIKKEDFDSLPVNDAGFVKLTLLRRKEVWQYWQTHYLVLNDYKKDKESDWARPAPADDDLPF